MTNYNVFISWSGAQAGAVGRALATWLPHVCQPAVPFFSPQDIQGGEGWPGAVEAGLKSARFAIICATPESIGKPWVNYEFGRLIGNDGLRAVPYLFGAGFENLAGTPMRDRQARMADEHGTRGLVGDLFKALLPQSPEGHAQLAFDKWWPDLKSQLDNVPTPPPVPEREETEVLAEILALLRRIDRTVHTSQSGGKVGLSAVRILTHDPGMLKDVHIGPQDAPGPGWVPLGITSSKDVNKV